MEFCKSKVRELIQKLYYKSFHQFSEILELFRKYRKK